MTSTDCKKAIVESCRNNAMHVKLQFTPPLDEIAFQETLKESNWKRISKSKEDECVIRDFDCKPFDDQLRATVVEANGSIVEVDVHGE